MEDVIVLVNKEYVEDKKRNYFEFYTFYNVTKGKYFYTQSLHNDLKELLDKIGSNFKDFNSYRKMVDHLDYEIGKQKYMERSMFSHEEVISLVSDNRALELIK